MVVGDRWTVTAVAGEVARVQASGGGGLTGALEQN